ncbi:MAG: type II toxin-antitoxin system HicB family antitoxin [Candidatus Binataceae bacterium]
MPLRIEVEREEDGRWLAETPELPGVMAYGREQREAVAKAKMLALRVIADRLEHDEPAPEPVSTLFALRGAPSITSITSA